jgi:hypothetical protein
LFAKRLWREQSARVAAESITHTVEVIPKAVLLAI